MFLEDLVQRLARWDVGLEVDELLAVERLDLDRLPFGEFVLRVADKDEGVLADVDDLQPGVAGGVGDEAQVNYVAQDIVVYLVVPAILDVHVNGGIVLQKLLHVGRQDVQADAVDGGHADVARDDVFNLLQLAVERVARLQNAFAVIVEDVAFRREAEVLLAALDQQRVEPPLQRADGLADG